MKTLLFFNLIGIFIFPFLIKKIVISGKWQYAFKPWHQLFHWIEFFIIFYVVQFNFLIPVYGLLVFWYWCDGYLGVTHLRIRMTRYADFRCSWIGFCEELGWTTWTESDERDLKLSQEFGEVVGVYGI